MYIDVVPNRNSRPAILLREGWREAGKIKKRTIANLTNWPPEVVDAIRLALKGKKQVVPEDFFTIERSLPHGRVEAILGMIRKLGLDVMISSRRCRERDLVVAMIVDRLICPRSKLSAMRVIHNTSLGRELGLEDANEDDLYGALDWLISRQAEIEKRLARRHLGEGGVVLYDVSSSWYEGRTCCLARYGHNRDGKRGKRIIVYGVMTDGAGRPVAVDVYPGNTGDPGTVADQVEKLRRRFGLQRVILAGDRGMLTAAQIERLRAHPGIGWLSALRSKQIRALLDAGAFQLSLFDERNLAEIEAPDFPGERLVVCRNPLLAEERERTRGELLAETERELLRIQRGVARRTRHPLGAGEIGLQVGRVINRWKVAKHFKVRIGDGVLEFERRADSIRREAELDGIYIIRTSEPAQRFSAAAAVRSYKSLSQVERLFRTLKGLTNRVRPIHHRQERRVRGHIFVCLLAYYVEWHMRRVLAELIFADEEVEENRQRRDPVLPAKPSATAQKKKQRKKTAAGLPVMSFDMLLQDLGTRCLNLCRFQSESAAPVIHYTAPTAYQKRIFELLETCSQ